jgi:hypothetical protein
MGQGAPSQQGRIQPQPSHRSCEVSHRMCVPQLGQGSVKSAMKLSLGAEIGLADVPRRL